VEEALSAVRGLKLPDSLLAQVREALAETIESSRLAASQLSRPGSICIWVSLPASLRPASLSPVGPHHTGPKRGVWGFFLTTRSFQAPDGSECCWIELNLYLEGG
jgi:hypothetical protein